MARLRTNIELEETHVRAIMDRYGIHTKTEAVALALRRLAGQPMTREEALTMEGARAIGEIPPDVGPSVILADTSAWVEYDRATGSPAHLRMRTLVDQGDALAVTEPVVMKVLAGARDELRERQLRRLLDRFPLLTFDSGVDFEGAVAIYRRCRRVGVTPRGLVDCLIAAVAWRAEATLLHQDTDLARVAEVLGLAVDRASLTT